MLKDIQNIRLMLQSGTLLEHRASNLELKTSWTQDHGKKISAFANRLESTPFWLCIGITDDGKLIGNNEKWAKETEETISQHLNQYLDPTQTCKGISCEELNGKWFIVIQIVHPKVVVYWNKSAYKGAGTTLKQMDTHEIMEMTYNLPGHDYSKQRWDGEYSRDMVRSFSNLLSEKRDDAAFASVLLSEPEVVLQRTRIENTNVQRILFGDCKYRVVYYDERDNPIKNESEYGLFGLLREEFINTIQSWTSSQIYTDPEPYPKRALKEALANAVAHAAYFDSDGDIILELFHDRLSISNLCLRESEYFANKWFSSSHKTVNRFLMETLNISGFVDALGRGKNLIFAQSLMNGKQPPQVVIERAGRVHRWRLLLYGGTQNIIQLNLLAQLRKIYSDEYKALFANALVFWRNQSISEIRKYIDRELLPDFIEILSDMKGPIFYWQEKDQILLRRWARILIGEDKDSKQFSDAEEQNLLNLAYENQTRYYNGYLTPKGLRELVGMDHTASEQALSSNLLKKWCGQGTVQRFKRGVYKFTPETLPRIDLAEILKNRIEATGQY